MLLKNFKKIGLMTLLLTNINSFANIEIGNIGLREGSLKYENSLFNQKINITPGCKSVKDVFEEIDEKMNYNIVNKSNIDLEAPICSAYKFNLLGDVLSAIIADANVIFYEKDHERIMIENAQEYSVKLPSNWDIQETLSLIRDKYPNIKSYSFGQTIRMTGNKFEMVEASKTLERIESWSQRSIPIIIKIDNLNTDKTNEDPLVISKINKMISDKSYKINTSHGIIFPIDEIGSVVFDLQKNRIILNGEKYIKFEEIEAYSFLKDGKQISFSVPFGTYIY